MPNTSEFIDYEQLTLAALEKASLSATPAQQRTHLNQASVFATLGEKQRGLHPGGARIRSR
ncbi:hypothetical protein GCM10008023_36550 [Sphingomonas glacialis]|uniref:Uncharacterized protein n=1 Tax=Sphingomonas glacialis TaxID=658225 RepID=A0ABQ3LTQ5_9SPHN|nr:hypothetical protein [Sphingomonas glacialis]GHH24479.1 hypothetical protein GCM10008023_36550 [Sphingomonas glacialis]